MDADRSARGRVRAEERGLAKEKVLQGRSDNPDWAGEQGTAGAAVPAEEPANEGKENNIMPRGDRTGPWGMGPMTGRGAGYCAGYGMPGYANPVPGRGFGMGFGGRGGGAGRGFGGGGRGWRHWFYATGVPGWMRFGGTDPLMAKPDPEWEKQALKNQAEALQSELDEIKKRLAEVESELKTD